jgi:hypothetical protein
MLGRGSRQLAAFAAAAVVATPGFAFDQLHQPTPGVKFYFSLPLDARNGKEQTMTAGFAIQGRRDYETVRIDSGMVNRFVGGGLEAKWLIAGVVAAGAAVAVASKDKSTAASQQQSQAQQAQQQAQQQQAQQEAQNAGGGTKPPCPVTPKCPGG